MAAAYEDSCIVLKVVKSCHEVTNAKQREFYVEPRLVHFWCNFWGIEKAYKIETQLLVGFILRRVRDSNPRTR